MDWQIGKITAQFEIGGHIHDIAIAGWVKEPFGLDFRVFDDDHGEPYIPGWGLTHLKAGCKICGLLVPLVKAKELADELSRKADWDFAEPSEAKSRSAVFEEFKAEHGRLITRDFPRFTPAIS